MESERMQEIRRLFLSLKFSEKDSANLQKRLKSTDIRRLEGRPLKGIKTGLTDDEYKSRLEELRPMLLLTEDNVNRLLAVCDNEGDECSSALEEINPHRDLFGFVAAAKVGGLIDVVHVACEADCEVKTHCCGCLSSERQRKVKFDYRDALVLNFMRIKVIEELRIEGLITRGQHHRKDRFKPKKQEEDH